MEFSVLSGPIRNIFHPQLSLLVQMKLRIGHSLALLAAKVSPNAKDEVFVLFAFSVSASVAILGFSVSIFSFQNFSVSVLILN